MSELLIFLIPSNNINLIDIYIPSAKEKLQTGIWFLLAPFKSNWFITFCGFFIVMLHLLHNLKNKFAQIPSGVKYKF